MLIKKRIIKFSKRTYINIFIKIHRGFINISGPFGCLNYFFDKSKILSINSKLFIKKDHKLLFVSLLNKMIKTSRNGIFRCLINYGFGIRVGCLNRSFLVDVGYSHICEFYIPSFLSIKCFKGLIFIKSIQLFLVYIFSTWLRKIIKVGPYKLKGILYKNEKIFLKKGKRE